MANTKTTTTTKTTRTTKGATKAAGNTPAKTQKAEVKKGHVFALVAGLTRKVEHKALKQAIKYHVAKGNLKLSDAGITLTQQGAELWNAERVTSDPAQFQIVSAYVHNKGEAPANSRWNTGGARIAIAEGLEFPPLIHWGSFAGSFMRQAFAAIWAK